MKNSCGDVTNALSRKTLCFRYIQWCWIFKTIFCLYVESVVVGYLFIAAIHYFLYEKRHFEHCGQNNVFACHWLWSSRPLPMSVYPLGDFESFVHMCTEIQIFFLERTQTEGQWGVLVLDPASSDLEFKQWFREQKFCMQSRQKVRRHLWVCETNFVSLALRVVLNRSTRPSLCGWKVVVLVLSILKSEHISWNNLPSNWCPGQYLPDEVCQIYIWTQRLKLLQLFWLQYLEEQKPRSIE